MAYTPYEADWEDLPAQTTPITAEFLEYIEDGVADAHTTADAAIPKSTVTTKGDLIVATASGTVTRVAVGAQGKTVIADSNASSGVKWTGAFSLTLPGSPVDGEEVLLTDSLTAPTYIWHMKYISGASTYKWYCIGGVPGETRVATSETDNGTAAYRDLATVGPTFTTPYEGDWFFGCGCLTSVDTSAANVWMSYAVGATAASDAWGVGGRHTTSGQNAMYGIRTYKHTAVAASASVQAKYKPNGGVVATWANRQLTYLPYRLTS
jgi:hypothetical protein